jgi:uncharacterized CHY-type Zn-finger protein
MKVKGFEVKGLEVDPETRCQHYHTAKDIIAIKFHCCKTYYSCYECHEAISDHPPSVWKKNEFDEKAILCGSCGSEITINQYLKSNWICPGCRAEFNPGCQNHYHLYFEV